MPRPLYVTQPLLPDLKDMQGLLEEIWQTKVLTNGGPMHQKLEQRLMDYLGVPTAMLFNNGTIALLAALKLFDLPAGSEVITTPLTFAATAHAICWNGLTPVFADVSPGTLTIDPDAVRKAVTGRTSAILGVHVYGTACDLKGLQSIADEYGLRLIYDAAHAFGTTVDEKSIGLFGDASIFSFHATKLFNTAEGGLITTRNTSDREPLYYLRNFGIKNEEEVISVGINGKLNEIQAAVGLLNLPLVNKEKKQRARLRERYCEFLASMPGIELQPKQSGISQSEQYFRVSIDAASFGRTRDDVYANLRKKQIFARKYFHPLCTDFESYRSFPIHSVRDEPYAKIVKSQVLCLPFHSGVSEEDVEDIRNEFISEG